MARGSASPGRAGKLFFVKVVTKKGQDPHFELTEAGDPEKKVTNETKLSGMLVAGAHKTFTSKAAGSDMDSISLTLFDAEADGGKGETYKIEQLLSGTSRDIINKLLGVDEFFTKNIEIRLYNNKEGFASTWVGFEGEDKGFGWTHEYEFLKTMIAKTPKKEKINGKIVESTVNDYMELNEFFIKEFKEKVIPKIKPSTKAHATVPDGTDTPMDGPSDDAPDSDLPF
jgi:hypothetical protein